METNRENNNRGCALKSRLLNCFALVTLSLGLMAHAFIVLVAIVAIPIRLVAQEPRSPNATVIGTAASGSLKNSTTTTLTVNGGALCRLMVQETFTAHSERGRKCTIPFR